MPGTEERAAGESPGEWQGTMTDTNARVWTNCPACGAPLERGAGGESLTCAYCRSIYFPEKNDDGVRVLGPAQGEMCPVCAVPLMEASLEQVAIRSCTRCRGMLIPMDSFAALLDAVRVGQAGGAAAGTGSADAAELERRLACPHCHGAMETHFYAGAGHVVIASCERCLLNWLDAGELARIAHGADALGETPVAW